MKIKKVLFSLFLGITLLSLSSCFKIDNWDEPNSAFRGTVYDVYTGAPLLASQNDWEIRIWERSWHGIEGGAVDHQVLRIKQDGTYQDVKLFDGTYDMYPYNGPFWPDVDTVKNVALKGSHTQDFTVRPYLQIVDFTTELDGVNLTLKFKVKAPLLRNDNVLPGRDPVLPDLYDVRFFISFNQFCGAGFNSNIDFDHWHSMARNGQRQPRQPITNFISETATGYGRPGNGVDTTGEFELGPVELRGGHKYYVRVGANVNLGDRKYNYSDIREIDLRHISP